jgi:adenylate cyclase
MLITCYQALGRPDDVRRAAEVVRERIEKILAHDRNDSRVLGHAAIVYSVLGQKDRARDSMNRALLINPDNVNMRYNFACTLATYLNEPDAALDMLAPAFLKMGLGLLKHAKVDPDFDVIRERPRFQAMIAEAEARLAAAPTDAAAAG